MNDAWPSRVEIPVAWGDMDAFGHVNNVVYFRWFETGRIDFFGLVGILEAISSLGQGPILAETQCRFRRPLFFPDTVTVRTHVTELEEGQFRMAYEAESHALGEIAARGSGRIVWFDYRGQRKALIPESIADEIRARCPTVNKNEASR